MAMTGLGHLRICTCSSSTDRRGAASEPSSYLLRCLGCIWIHVQAGDEQRHTGRRTQTHGPSIERERNRAGTATNVG
eukprot:26823-Eustigmatos_ZCMA.PRE.1